jgi:uncharacterized membrane protein SirB2
MGAYLLLRLLHLGCAALSLAFFVWRGLQALRAPQQRQRRVLPHVIDTLFLASGLALAATLHQYPFVHGWLTAKVFGLILYIVLGSVAIRPGRPLRLRVAAFAAALLTFGYIVGVARLRHPLSWLTPLAG